MGFMTIAINIFIFFLGAICGVVLDCVIVYNTYTKSLDDVYNAGYEQGAKEEKQKHIEWLEKVANDK